MNFSRLEIEGWRQFEKVEIDFHPRLTIVTGANGAGKSTLLRILSQHFGWSYSLLATPTYNRGILSYFSGIFADSEEVATRRSIGNIVYSDGAKAEITVPRINSVQYNISINNQRPIDGLNIESHRPATNYQQVSSIPTNAMSARDAYQIYNNEYMQRSQNAYVQFSPIYRMKEAIISMATFGPGNQYVQRNELVAKLFEEFKSILSKTLPPSIGFRDINVRIPNVVIVTSTGDFVIDAASGGLMSLIDLAWRIFLYAHDKSEFVAVIDEPENHLHPSMQRALLGRLLNAFPKAQFIVATHSPFVVSSVKDSSVFVLGYNPTEMAKETGIATRVNSIKLDRANKAGTASEILRDVLGVPVTLPEWAEDELRAISSSFEIATLTSDNITALRERLDAAGLGEYYPEALRQIAGRQA